MRTARLILMTMALVLVFTAMPEARWYSPEMKRFISEDPMGYEAGDVNFYRYVGNSPVNWTDPLGLKAIVTGCGDNVTIYLPIQFESEFDTGGFSARFRNAVEDKFSGQFGKYNVTTKVTDGNMNIARVHSGSGRAMVFPGGTRALLFYGDANSTLAHEAGHLIGLLDRFGQAYSPEYKGNLMACEEPYEVTERDIEEILNSLYNIVNYKKKCD